MYTITLRRTADGVERPVIETGEWPDDEFYWTEGNMACDCNRHNVFNGTTVYATTTESECGESRYSIVRVADRNGTLVFSGEGR